jgi:hypothetical protein
VGTAELRVYGFSTSNAPSPAPTADDKNLQTKAGTPAQITLTGSDPISVGALKFSVVSLPQHGSLVQGTMPNSLIWTPNNGFSYKATNSQGVDSNIAAATINVNGSSHAVANGATIQSTSVRYPSRRIHSR